MRSATSCNVATAAALCLLQLQLLLLSTSEAFKVRMSVPKANSIAYQIGRTQPQNSPSNINGILSLRGGDDVSSSTLDMDIDVDEIESSDAEEDEEEDEDEEEELDSKLVKAAQAASSKVKAKAVKAATAASKEAVASTLLANKPKAKQEASGLANFFQIPYIIKACMNPFIFVQMTKEYWKSLVNHKYGEAVKVGYTKRREHAVHRNILILTNHYCL